MADFSISYKIVRANEGGYANNPNDRGGETYKGISRKNNPDLGLWDLIDSYKKFTNFPASLEADTDLQMRVLAFYKDVYWNKLNLPLVADQSIATELFDTAVNTGRGTAGMFLQRALNISNLNQKIYPDLHVDGQVGTETVTALNQHPNPALIMKLLNVMQGAKYIEICEANPSQEEFLKSWMSRVTL